MWIRTAHILNIISKPLNKYAPIHRIGRWKENKCLAEMVMQGLNMDWKEG
jgi:hypothetical protein